MGICYIWKCFGEVVDQNEEKKNDTSSLVSSHHDNTCKMSFHLHVRHLPVHPNQKMSNVSCNTHSDKIAMLDIFSPHVFSDTVISVLHITFIKLLNYSVF